MSRRGRWSITDSLRALDRSVSELGRSSVRRVFVFGCGRSSVGWLSGFGRLHVAGRMRYKANAASAQRPAVGVVLF